jgi:hypothetical protein
MNEAKNNSLESMAWIKLVLQNWTSNPIGKNRQTYAKTQIPHFFLPGFDFSASHPIGDTAGQVIMKVRSKADLRSALLRTLVLGVLFGLTFLQLEKRQSEARQSEGFQYITVVYPCIIHVYPIFSVSLKDS